MNVGLGQILLEGRLENLIDKYNIGKETIFYKFLLHPFNKKTNFKYADWTLKKTLEGNQYDEAYLNEIIPYLEKFERAGSNLDRKDINQYKSLLDFMNELDNYKSKSEAKADSITVYETDDILIVRPLTQRSSCMYGSSSKWCTAAKDNNRFEQYNTRGPLLYVIPKKGDRQKFALHYDTNLDRLVSYNELDMVIPNSNVPYIDRVKLYLKDNFNMGDIIGRINKKFSSIKDQKIKGTFQVGDFTIKDIKVSPGKMSGRLGDDKFVLELQNDTFLFYLLKTNIWDQSPHLDHWNEVIGNAYKDEKNFFSFLIMIIDFFVNKHKEAIKQVSGNKKPIKPPREGYKFSKRDGDYRYNQIIGYIKDMKSKGEIPTKTDFVTKQLKAVGRDPSEVEMRGYLVNVFGALKDAGLITVYRSSERPYYRLDLGPNYDKWKEDKLEVVTHPYGIKI
jgi:hypothetical protein